MEVREGSMGKPMPGWEVAILDEDERPVASGERGEISAATRSNPHYPLGYWNRPAQDTEEAFGGDWFTTWRAPTRTAYFWDQGLAYDAQRICRRP